MKATVISGQGIMDVSIEHTGAIEDIFNIALANGKRSITDDLGGGEGLVFDPVVTNKTVLDTYSRKIIHPGSQEIIMLAPDVLDDGIGFMIIGDDFIIA